MVVRGAHRAVEAVFVGGEVAPETAWAVGDKAHSAALRESAAGRWARNGLKHPHVGSNDRRTGLSASSLFTWRAYCMCLPSSTIVFGELNLLLFAMVTPFGPEITIPQLYSITCLHVHAPFICAVCFDLQGS